MRVGGAQRGRREDVVHTWVWKIPVAPGKETGVVSLGLMANPHDRRSRMISNADSLMRRLSINPSPCLELKVPNAFQQSLGN
jgi:hypothetical protein